MLILGNYFYKIQDSTTSINTPVTIGLYTCGLKVLIIDTNFNTNQIPCWEALRFICLLSNQRNITQNIFIHIVIF